MMEAEMEYLMKSFLLGISFGVSLKLTSELIYATVKSLYGAFRNITR